MNLKIVYSEEDISALAEGLLESVDYDIYKEDLESREILEYLEWRIRYFIDNCEVVCE